MEKRFGTFSIPKRVTSTQTHGLYSQVAPKRPLPPPAHQNRGNVHGLPFNPPWTNIPHVFLVPPIPQRLILPPKKRPLPPQNVEVMMPPKPKLPQLPPQWVPQQYPPLKRPQPPPQKRPQKPPKQKKRLPPPQKRPMESPQQTPPTTIPVLRSFQTCNIPSYNKCTIIPVNAGPIIDTYRKQLQLRETKLDNLFNLLVVKDVKIKDLKKLSDGQAAEVRKMNNKLDMQQTEYDDMKIQYRGEIVRLNDLILEYQRKEEEYKSRIASGEENDKALKELLEFIRIVNAEAQAGAKYLTDQYYESSKSEEELVEEYEEADESEATSESCDVKDETASLVEQVERAKDEFKETTFILEHFTEMGLEKFSKQIEDLRAENAALAKTQPQVSKIHLRKVSVGGRESKLQPQWSIVNPGDEDEPILECNGDEDDLGEISTWSGMETPPPVLYPYNDEIYTGNDGPFHNKVKRGRPTKESSSHDYQFKGTGHDNQQVCLESGGKKKGTALKKNGKCAAPAKQQKGQIGELIDSKKKDKKVGKCGKNIRIRTNKRNGGGKKKKTANFSDDESVSEWTERCTQLMMKNMADYYKQSPKSSSIADVKKPVGKKGGGGNQKSNDGGEKAKVSKPKYNWANQDDGEELLDI